MPAETGRDFAGAVEESGLSLRQKYQTLQKWLPRSACAMFSNP